MEVMAAKAIDPLGVVAHGDGDPVAGLHAVALDQRGGEGVDAAARLARRLALVLVDEERGVAVAPGQVGQIAQGGGGAP